MITLQQAKAEIERLTSFVPVELQALICHVKGDNFQPHGRLGYAIMRPGSRHWESRPDFGDFDKMHRYLLDRHTRVLLLQETGNRKKLPRWKCQLTRDDDERRDEGVGYGRDAAAALMAAWLGLEIERSGKAK